MKNQSHQIFKTEWREDCCSESHSEGVWVDKRIWCRFWTFFIWWQIEWWDSIGPIESQVKVTELRIDFIFPSVAGSWGSFFMSMNSASGAVVLAHMFTPHLCSIVCVRESHMMTRERFSFFFFDFNFFCVGWRPKCIGRIERSFQHGWRNSVVVEGQGTASRRQDEKRAGTCSSGRRIWQRKEKCYTKIWHLTRRSDRSREWRESFHRNNCESFCNGLGRRRTSSGVGWNRKMVHGKWGIPVSRHKFWTCLKSTSDVVLRITCSLSLFRMERQKNLCERKSHSGNWNTCDHQRGVENTNPDFDGSMQVWDK